MEDTCFVCMTVYNGQQFLRDAIESVLMQQDVQVHFCIVDDGSTDGSAQLLAAYAEQNPKKIQVLTNPWNQGIGQALSRALRHYRGEAYFAMIGQDDQWSDHFLSSQIAYLTVQEAVASFSTVRLVDEQGKILSSGSGFVRFAHDRLQELDQQELLQALIHGNFLCASSALVSMARVGTDISLCELFGVHNDRLQDQECWLNLCLRGQFVYHKQAYVRYRVHRNNFSRPEKRWMQVRLEEYEMLDRVLNSDGFWRYIHSVGSPASALKGVVQAVQERSAESNPCRLLVVKLCETASLQGIETPALSGLLAKSYQDFGLLSKAYRVAGELPMPIPISFANTDDAEICGPYLKEAGLFCQEPIQTQGCLQAAVWPSAQGVVPGTQIVFILPQGDAAEAKAAYPKALIQYAERIDVQRLLSFVEDETAVFRNGILDRYPINNNIVNYYQDILCSGITLNSRIFKLCRYFVRLLRQYRIKKTL